MKLVKLTENDMTTGKQFGHETQWCVGKPNKLTVVDNPGLCTSQVFHAYTSPLLAAMMHPGVSQDKNNIAWDADGDVVVSDGTRVGVFTLMINHRIDLPKPRLEQVAKFAILCAMEACTNPTFLTWGKKWVSGEDRRRLSVERTLLSLDNRVVEDGYAHDIIMTLSLMHEIPNMATRSSLAKAISWISSPNKHINYEALAEKAMEPECGV